MRCSEPGGSVAVAVVGPVRRVAELLSLGRFTRHESHKHHGPENDSRCIGVGAFAPQRHFRFPESAVSHDWRTEPRSIVHDDVPGLDGAGCSALARRFSAPILDRFDHSSAQVSSMTRTRPNHALQRTRRVGRGCNRCVPCAGSLSLGR